MTTFYQYLLKLEAGPTPPGGPPTPGASPTPGGASGSAPTSPPPGGDPLGGGLGGGMGGGMGGGAPGGDPMGGGAMGGAGGAPMTRKAINITTWEDALKLALGKNAERPPEPTPIHHKHKPINKEKPPKSLSQ